MPYPSVVTTFTNPSPSDRLSTTPHSAIETAQNTGLTEIQTFVGTASSTQGTLMFDIRSSNSNGGGHVQTANKGGTGQTMFNKGDVLVGQSTSVLTKLAIGSDNQVLTADSTQAAGVKWAGVANATDLQNETYTYARASVMSASVYGVVLAQAVSILSDGLGLVVKWPTTNTTSVLALTVNATGPSSVTGLIKKTDLSNVSVGEIRSSMISVLKFDSVSSVFQILNTSISTYKNGTASKDSSDASTTQTIAHGLGVLPKKVKITAIQDTTATAQASAHAETSYNGISQSSISIAGAPNSFTGSTLFILNANNGSTNTQTGVVTFDETNIYIVWTKANSPTGIFNLLWEAQA